MDPVIILVTVVVGVMVAFGFAGLALVQKHYKEKGGLDAPQGTVTRTIGMVQALLIGFGLILIVVAMLSWIASYAYTGAALLFLALIAEYARFATRLAGE